MAKPRPFRVSRDILWRVDLTYISRGSRVRHERTCRECPVAVVRRVDRRGFREVGVLLQGSYCFLPAREQPLQTHSKAV